MVDTNSQIYERQKLVRASGIIRECNFTETE
jgi:hypothetical protein